MNIEWARYRALRSIHMERGEPLAAFDRRIDELDYIQHKAYWDKVRLLRRTSAWRK